MTQIRTFQVGRPMKPANTILLVLLILERNKKTTHKELLLYIGYHQATIITLTSNMAHLGLIKKIKSGNTNIITLTPKGQELIRKTMHDVN